MTKLKLSDENVKLYHITKTLNEVHFNQVRHTLSSVLRANEGKQVRFTKEIHIYDPYGDCRVPLVRLYAKKKHTYAEFIAPNGKKTEANIEILNSRDIMYLLENIFCQVSYADAVLEDYKKS